MGSRSIAAHIRHNTSITAAAEKRVLHWLALRMPEGVHSDHLSALGLGAMACAGLAFASFRLSPWAALGVTVALALNWFGDSLDGTLARVRQQQRPRYGFYVDHVIDLAGTTCLLGGLAASGLMHPVVAGTVLATYLLVSAESYLATHVVGVFRMSHLGVGPTELRLLLVAGAVRVAWSPFVTVAGAHVRLFDAGGAIAAAGLVVVFVAASIRNGLDLSGRADASATADGGSRVTRAATALATARPTDAQARGDLTSTPAAVRPARSHAAIDAAPGVSP